LLANVKKPTNNFSTKQFFVWQKSINNYNYIMYHVSCIICTFNNCFYNIFPGTCISKCTQAATFYRKQILYEWNPAKLNETLQKFLPKPKIIGIISHRNVVYEWLFHTFAEALALRIFTWFVHLLKLNTPLTQSVDVSTWQYYSIEHHHDNRSKQIIYLFDVF
jgi:hypothetical protein